MQPVRCPFDQVFHHSSSVMVGEFSCRADHPCFSDTGPIENHLLVVPGRPVAIHLSRARKLVADRTRVLMYNRGTTFRREALNQVGDHCLWFAFDDRLLEEHCGGTADQPFREPVRHLPRNAFLKIRRLYVRLRAGRASALQVDETAFGLLDLLTRRTNHEGVTATARQQRAVTAAEAYLAGHYTDEVKLEDVAKAAACSPFHLSRLFRRQRGVGLHRHLSELRLRDAVDRLCGSDTSMTDIAMQLGFSSPSHFSAQFSERLGVAPSRFRRHVNAIRAIS